MFLLPPPDPRALQRIKTPHLYILQDMKRFSQIFRSIALKAQALVLLSFMAFAVISPTNVHPTSPASAKAETAATRTVQVSERVEHLFTHCLIAHPEIAFAPKNEYGKHLDRDCLTPYEFRRILNFLYEGGYALVDINETFRENGEVAERCPFEFPVGKRPLILSFDDVVYASKNKGKGMADKLIVTKDGTVAAYTANRTNQIHEEEFVPILESFIRTHPDFSYKNARGTIFLTGFDGILGYRTQRDAPDRENEIKEAKKVVAALKKTGWSFGSHSYAHGHIKKYTAEQMLSDTEKWKNEVENLVGATQVYAYPYGEWILGPNCSDPRQQVLIHAGFRLFCGVGENPYYTKMPLGEQTMKILFQDRCALDGISLRNDRCSRFFDARKVYDPARSVSFPFE